jgi:hypothetical protein
MKKIFLLVPCFASCLFLVHCTDDDAMSDATGGTQSSGGSVNGGTSSGGASGAGAGSGGQSGSAGSESTGGSGGSGQSGASGSGGLGGTSQGGVAGDGGEGASGGASACEPETGDGACKECMRQSCCDEVAPCEANEGCSACVECVDEMGDLGACAVGSMPPCPTDLTTMPGPAQDMLLCLFMSCLDECGLN